MSETAGKAYYTCGSEARVGDLVRVVDASGSGNPPILREGSEHRVEAIIPDGPTSPCPFVVQLEDHKPYDKFWTVRFELISRATPSAPAERKVEDGFDVGMVVVAAPGFALRDGSGVYEDAILVSVDPLVAVSREGDMMWQATITKERLRVVRRASDDECVKAFRRWDNEPKPSPSRPASEAGETEKTIVIPEMAVVVTQLSQDETEKPEAVGIVGPDGRGSATGADACNTAADSGHAKGSVAQGAEAVIKGEGEYETEESDRVDNYLWRAEIVGRSKRGGNWAGFCGPDRTPCAWRPNGQCETQDARFNITGPYVEPPKPPVLPLLTAVRQVLDWYDRDGSVGGLADPIEELRESFNAEAGKEVE